jgi:hypothetical protein
MSIVEEVDEEDEIRTTEEPLSAECQLELDQLTLLSFEEFRQRMVEKFAVSEETFDSQFQQIKTSDLLGKGDFGLNEEFVNIVACYIIANRT